MSGNNTLPPRYSHLPSLPARRSRDGIRPNWHKIFWDGRVGRTLFQSSKKRRGKGWLNSCVRAGMGGYLAFERDVIRLVPHIFLFRPLKVLFSLNCWIIVWFIHVLIASFKVCFKQKCRALLTYISRCNDLLKQHLFLFPLHSFFYLSSVSPTSVHICMIISQGYYHTYSIIVILYLTNSSRQAFNAWGHNWASVFHTTITTIMLPFPTSIILLQPSRTDKTRNSL